MSYDHYTVKLDCTILHLEDDNDDSFFFQRVLERLQFGGIYRRTTTVEETIDYLTGAKTFADRQVSPLPHVLVADSSLGTGRTTADLRRWLDEHEEFRRLVRIILTGDMSMTSQQKWLSGGMACVLLKGGNLEELKVSVEEILRRCIDQSPS